VDRGKTYSPWLALSAAEGANALLVRFNGIRESIRGSGHICHQQATRNRIRAMLRLRQKVLAPTHDPKRTRTALHFTRLHLLWEMIMRALVLSASLLLLFLGPVDAKHRGAKHHVTAKSLDAQAINNAAWDRSLVPRKSISPATIKTEILLARARFSPGEISGRSGENLSKAIAAFAEAQGIATDKLNDQLWDKLVSISGAPVVVAYTLSDEDVRGPFLENLPSKMERMKGLPNLSYTTPTEKLAEKFHMSPELLEALNPGEKFRDAGHTIMVANIPADPLPEKVNRIQVDKSRQELRAFDGDGKLLAYYPATVGSDEKPAPSGTLKVTIVKKNPAYHYNPAYAFKGVQTEKPFTIKPGPNNPVGVVWIGLTGEGYGIHGTAEPEKVGKTQSHGCVRLTNWDALQLASGVRKGVLVDFVGEQYQSEIRNRRRSTNNRYPR
jgi:lipoprotein-anchoring transpeptidase ErfK/SrfK